MEFKRLPSQLLDNIHFGKVIRRPFVKFACWLLIAPRIAGVYAISLSVVVVLSSSWFLMQNGLFASHDSQKNIAYALSMFLEVVGVVLFERCDFYFLIMANGGCVCVTVCVCVCRQFARQAKLALAKKRRIYKRNPVCNNLNDPISMNNWYMFIFVCWH